MPQIPLKKFDSESSSWISIAAGSVSDENTEYTVDDITNIDAKTNTAMFSISFLKKYAINIDSASFPVLTVNRRAKKTFDREILFFGDSHGWGQGAPENDFEGVYFSRHMSFPYSEGFFARLLEHLEQKYKLYTTSIIPFSTSNELGAKEISQILFADKEGINKNSDCIHILSGNYGEGSLSLITPVEASGFYSWAANSDNAVANIGYFAFQNKIGTGALIIGPEKTQKTQRVLNRYDYFEVVPNGKYATESGFTLYKNNGGIYYLLTSGGSSNVIHTAEYILPDWLSIGSYIYIPGYGEVKVSNILPLSADKGGVNIFLTRSDGTILTDDLSPYLYAGAKVYQSKINTAMFRVEMKDSVRKVYIGAQKGPTCGKFEVFFSDENNGITNAGLLSLDRRNTANAFYPAVSGYPKVYKVVDGSHTLLSSPEVVINTGNVVIDTYATSASECVYCIDYGLKQKGDLYFGYAGANGSATNFTTTGGTAYGSPVIKLRGIIFGGNNVRNFSIGAAAVGSWLNDGSPHYIDEILNYVPFTPTLAVVQAPIVNEYLAQTSIATFKSNLAALVTKLNNHKNSGGTKKTDFLFLSTIGDKTIQYQGAGHSAINYSDYFVALKEFCEVNNYGLIDFNEYFQDSVDKGMLDYELLYDDQIHPSSFANEFIGGIISNVIDLLM